MLTDGRLSNLLLLFLVLLTQAGCASRPGPEALVLSSRFSDDQLVTVLVATDREPLLTAESSYGGGRSDVMRYEAFVLSLPSRGADETGNLIGAPPAAVGQVKVVQRSSLTRSTFLEQVRRQANAGNGDVGVFVHGYNYNFQEALFRVGQLGALTGNRSTLVLFSWPSEAVLGGYVADRDAVTFSRDHLSQLLSDVSALELSGRVGVVGHSMGSWLVMEALREERLKENDAVVERLSVTLAAPDIDIDVFRSQLSVVGRLHSPLTLLVSPDDRALELSRRIANGRLRVGLLDVHDPILQEIATSRGVRVVDISTLAASDRFNHDRFISFAADYAQSMRNTPHRSSLIERAGVYIFTGPGSLFSRPGRIAGRD